MAQKITYFTAGKNPTEGELADIAKLILASTPEYETLVVNGEAITGDEYGAGRLIPCDFAAGTIPTDYSGVDVMDPDAIPNCPLLDTQSIVTDGDDITLDSSLGTVGITVVDFDITGAVLALADAKAIVTDADEVTLDDSMGTVTLAVSGNAITGAELVLPATKAVVANTDALVVPVTGVYATTATFTVAGGVITGIVLS